MTSSCTASSTRSRFFPPRQRRCRRQPLRAARRRRRRRRSLSSLLSLLSSLVVSLLFLLLPAATTSSSSPPRPHENGRLPPAPTLLCVRRSSHAAAAAAAATEALLGLLPFLSERCCNNGASDTFPTNRIRGGSDGSGSDEEGEGKGSRGAVTNDPEQQQLPEQQRRRESLLRATAAAVATTNVDGFSILKEEVLHDGWRRLINRRVRMPPRGRLHVEESAAVLEVDFELVAQRGVDEAVLVFAWDAPSRTATLVREYMPSVHRKMMGLAAGMVEPEKHGGENENGGGSAEPQRGAEDIRLTAARHELEEECYLTDGTWYRLTPAPVPAKKDDNNNIDDDDTNGNADVLLGGVVMDKYSTTRLTAYLVVGAKRIPASRAKPRDDTEVGMEVVRGVTLREIRGMLERGEMTVVGSWATLLALNKLRELGLVADDS